MKKSCLMIACLLTFFCANATNYYVDIVNGSSGYSGLSPSQAFKSIPTSTVLPIAGDTVFIMNGSYPPFNITSSGNATAQIVYTNYPGHTPKIVSASDGFTYIVVGIKAGASYITLNGLEVVGYGVNLSLAADTIPAQAAVTCPVAGTRATSTTFISKYNGNGIYVDGTAALTHHIVISNNKVHDCAAAGIGFNYSDYITVTNNTVYNNCWYTPYGTSGIQFNYCTNYDNNITTYRNIITNNVSYNNRLYVPWNSSCTLSDGNGIILDIPFLDTVTNSPTKGKILYTGKQLVANNVCFNNGGSGIHTLNNNHVDFLNNVVYLNNATPSNGGSSLYAYASDDVKFYNNILVSRPGKTVNRCFSTTNVIYDYNVYSGGVIIDSLSVVGRNSFLQDPMFVNASTDPSVADFHFQASSCAINNGDNTHTYATDKDGTTRPIGSVTDMGAYEFTGTPTNVGNLTAGNISVVRVGDGTNALSANAAAVNLLEYTAAGIPTGVNVTLGDAGSVSPNRIVISGSSTTGEGQLSLSSNGRYLSLAGYDGAVGATTNTFWTGDKVITRIGYNAGVDYSTRFSSTIYNGTIRSATTDFSSRFYVTGTNNLTGSTGSATSNPTRFLVFGSPNTTASSPVNPSLRSLKTFKGLLYYANNNQVGLLTYVASSNYGNATPFSGVNVTGHNYQSFALLDMDATASYNGTGYDVLYCADQTLGLVKFYWNGSTWVLAGIYNPISATGVTGGLQDITARLNSSGNAEIYAVKGAASNNNILSIIDVSGFAGSIATTVPTVVNLTSAGNNYMYRGVAFSPTVYQGTTTILPVTLLSFNGNLLGEKVLLDWVTSTEVNTKEYLVEKSLDGVTFNTIGTVTAKNNIKGHAYDFADMNLIAGQMFYRLKLVDRDGSFKYSNIVLIKGGLTVTSGLKIFPNPVTSYFSIAFPIAVSNASLSILSVDGKKLAEYIVATGSSQRSIDVSALSHGHYLVIYKNNNQIMSSSLVK